MFEYDYLIQADGGSRGNGAQNDAYGSYRLATRDDRETIQRLDLGTGTNNEAEYRTLIAALKDLASRIERTGNAPSDYSVLAHTDSQLMVGQLARGWKVKAANLRPLVDEATKLMQGFGRCDLVKVPREEIVRVLGH
ncbi:MAG: reverse transcriptase-like protein [Anaerolineae bacterium]|jgi:ribonuclease HI